MEQVYIERTWKLSSARETRAQAPEISQLTVGQQARPNSGNNRKLDAIAV